MIIFPRSPMAPSKAIPHLGGEEPLPRSHQRSTPPLPGYDVSAAVL